MLFLYSLDASAGLQRLALNRGNRRSSRTTSPNMQTAPLQPSHQQKMHQTWVLPGRGVASYPLQHSPPNFQHLPHTQPGPLQTSRRTSCRSATAERCSRRSYSGGISTRCCLISTAASTYERPTAASLPTTARTWSTCLLYTSPSPRDKRQSRMPSSA